MRCSISAQFKDFDLQLHPLSISGGAPLPPRCAKKFEERSGCRLIEGYGLCRSLAGLSPAIPSIPAAKTKARIGLPYPFTSCEIVSLEDRHDALEDRVKRARSASADPQVMHGLLERPDATAEVIDDGCLHTGDVGHIDEEAASSSSPTG